jgi:hypothetical protein
MKKIIYNTVIASSLLLFGCKKDTKNPDPEIPIPLGPTYTVPTTYNFTNVNYVSSTQRLSMLGEITTYLRATHTTTQSTQPTVTAQKLKDMFANMAAPFTDGMLNSSSIQLKDKTSNTFTFVTELENAFTDAEPASIFAAANPTTSTASNGIKGKLNSPTRAILVNANGFEYKEIAEKGLMGAMLYYEAINLLKNISTFDNVSVVAGQGTAQEHAWDEAFGYFGVPISFPTSTVGVKNWGTYCNAVNDAIGSNTTIMNAFLKGRAAISNNDASGRDAARDVVISTWEKVAAAKCISYLKGAKNNLAPANQPTLFHNLSEGYGFVTAFRYNPSKTISDADINLLLSYFGTNLYNINTGDIDLAINKLAAVFSIDATLVP